MRKTKKVLKLKKSVIENVVVFVVGTLLFLGCCKCLALINEYEYKKAITRCNGENNIVTKYDSTGEKYYLCKVEK